MAERKTLEPLFFKCRHDSEVGRIVSIVAEL